MPLCGARPADARRTPALGGRHRQHGRRGRRQRRLDRARRAVRSHPRPACSAAAATAATPVRPGRRPGARRRWRPRARVVAAALADPAPAGRLDRWRGHPNGTDGAAAGRVGAVGPRDLEDRRALVHDALAGCRGLPRLREPRRRPGQAAPGDEGERRRRCRRSPPASRSAYTLSAFQTSRRLAERPDRPGHLHAAAVRQPGLHGRARRSRSACRS